MNRYIFYYVMDMFNYVKKLNIHFNPIPTGLGHVTLIYGLIPPMAGRNRVKAAMTYGGP